MGVGAGFEVGAGATGTPSSRTRMRTTPSSSSALKSARALPFAKFTSSSTPFACSTSATHPGLAATETTDSVFPARLIVTDPATPAPKVWVVPSGTSTNEVFSTRPASVVETAPPGSSGRVVLGCDVDGELGTVVPRSATSRELSKPESFDSNAPVVAAAVVIPAAAKTNTTIAVTMRAPVLFGRGVRSMGDSFQSEGTRPGTPGGLAEVSAR